MNQVLIVFPDTPQSVLDMLARETHVVGPIDASDDWLIAMRDSAAVITVVQPQFTGAVMDASPRLRVIGRPGIGVDNVDLRAATERGICVVNTPDAPTQPVVEKVIAWILMLSHRLRDADRVTRVENWAGRSALMGNDVFGKTLGLIGTGRVGSRVAQICSSAFGMRVLAFDPYANAERMKQCGVELVASVDALVPQCDFVSINCPLTPETRGLIGEKQLRAMKSSAYLINSARAPVVDEDALVRALRERWIKGAALDVFNTEPPPPNHPLLTFDNVVVGPHLGSFTQEAMLRMLSQTAEQVLMVLRGERPPNLVNADVWGKRKQ
ncbi:MAG: hydroxyacid dehydrogenase [Chloroflexi bacterium]|nr:hydroxyacid dehydrogenase [Chloroflexota bacterium]